MGRRTTVHVGNLVEWVAQRRPNTLYAWQINKLFADNEIRCVRSSKACFNATQCKFNAYDWSLVAWYVVTMANCMRCINTYTHSLLSHNANNQVDRHSQQGYEGNWKLLWCDGTDNKINAIWSAVISKTAHLGLSYCQVGAGVRVLCVKVLAWGLGVVEKL